MESGEWRVKGGEKRAARATLHSPLSTLHVSGLRSLGRGRCSGALAGDEAVPTEPQTAVVAVVAEDPIRSGEVTRLVTKVTRGQPATPAALAILQAQTLEEIIDRRLVLAYARRNDEAPTDEQLQAARTEFEAQIGASSGARWRIFCGSSRSPRPISTANSRGTSFGRGIWRATAPRRGPRRISRPIAGSSTAPRWP